MEYHEDRFTDHSLMVLKDDTLVGLLPANVIGNTAYAHQGLTYGGLICNRTLKLNDFIETFRAILIALQTEGIETLNLKAMPSIYCAGPNSEIDYVMFLLEAQLTRRDALSVIDLREDIKFSSSRVEGCKRAMKHGLKVEEEDDLNSFWNAILVPNLKNKYNTNPVHSLEEISLLKERFSRNIRQFNVYHKNELVAGTTIFETKNVAHAQYISGNAENSKLGSLDMLYSHLIKEVYNNKKFLDFGISNMNEGKNVNSGLQFWKEGFGARTITQDFYSIPTGAFNKLEKVMV